jgi:hypothetical protein
MPGKPCQEGERVMAFAHVRTLVVVSFALLAVCGAGMAQDITYEAEKPWSTSYMDTVVGIGVDDNDSVRIGGYWCYPNVASKYLLLVYDFDLDALEDSETYPDPNLMCYMHAFTIDGSGNSYMTGNGRCAYGTGNNFLTCVFDESLDLDWSQCYPYDEDPDNFLDHRGYDLAVGSSGDSDSTYGIGITLNDKADTVYMVYYTENDAKCYMLAYDASDGDELWSAGHAPAGTFRDVLFVPGDADTNDRVLLLTSSNLKCYERHLGLPQWAEGSVDYEKMAIFDDGIIVLAGEGGVAKYDVLASSNQAIWEWSDEDYTFYDVAVTEFGSIVAVGSDDDDYVVAYFNEFFASGGSPTVLTQDGGNDTTDVALCVTTKGSGPAYAFVTGQTHGDGSGDKDIVTMKFEMVFHQDICAHCDYPNDSTHVAGDADRSGEVDIDDVVFLVAYIFSSGPAPNPMEAGDADSSESCESTLVDIDDVVYLIAYIFDGGPDPICTE